MPLQSSIVLFLRTKQAEAIALRLLLNVHKMIVQRPSIQQVIIQYPVVLLQKGSPPLAVNADGAPPVFLYRETISSCCFTFCFSCSCG